MFKPVNLYIVRDNNTRIRIFFFSPEFNIMLYDKHSESDYFFFLHQNQNIFFSNIGKPYPPFKLNGRSLNWQDKTCLEHDNDKIVLQFLFCANSSNIIHQQTHVFMSMVIYGTWLKSTSSLVEYIACNPKGVQWYRGRRGRDRMVVGLTTTYSISAYHHQSCEFELRSWWGVLDTTLCDRFFSVTCDKSVVFSGYSRLLHQWFPDRHDITEICWKRR